MSTRERARPDGHGGQDPRHGRDDEIEFLAPRADLFTGGPTLHEIAPSPGAPVAFSDVDEADAAGSRWSTLAAAAGLLAMITLGVIAAAPWQQDDTAAAPVTTPPPPSSLAGIRTTGTEVRTAPTLSPADAAAPTPGFLIDAALLPPRMTALPASMPAELVGTDAAASPDGWLDLWSTPGGGRTTGSWFSLGWTPATGILRAEGTARVSAGESIGLLRVDPDGVSNLMFERDGGTATLSWFGLASGDMDLLASGVTFGSEGTPTYPRDPAQLGLQRLVHRAGLGREPIADFLHSQVTARVMYELPGGGYLEIVTQRSHPDHTVIRPFVLASMRTDALSGPSVFREVAGRSVVVGALRGDPWLGSGFHHLLEWTEEGMTVQVSADLASSQLLALVPLIERGDAGDWYAIGAEDAEAAEDAAQDAVEDAVEEVDAEREAVEIIGFGDLELGGEWFVGVDPIQRTAHVQLARDARGRHASFSIDLATGSCGATSDAVSTVVVCVGPADVPGRTMHLQGAFGSRDVELQHLATSSTYTVGIIEFHEPGGFVVEIHDGERTIPGLRVGIAPA